MTLTPGTKLGAYDVLASIGSGGMGEVYRARDSRLQRYVALKVLPELFAADPERLARFQREAQVLASLNHPNIASIYGIEEAGGARALVLELVEGQTLAERIAQGPIPLEETLPIARQITEALEAAHEQGIIHRDLKPANIKVQDNGTVKVLDFGLAKLKQVSTPGSQDPDVTASPTITSPALMTRVGVILGTAAYMAPEQAKGRPADKRSDIWAFGCVVYEMLTGKRAFDGEDMTDVLGAVARLDPDWSALPPEVPPAIRTLLQSCLVKDRRHRVADISTALFVLDKAPNLTSAMPSGGPVLSGDRRSLWRRLALMAAVFLAGVVVTGAAWSVMQSAPPRVTRLTITPPANAALRIDGIARDVAISPDGTRVVYAGGRPTSLFVRALDRLTPTALSGLGEPRVPVFSPDGQWIAFFDANTSLRKVAVTGGSPVTLSRTGEAARGVTWRTNDTIVFATFSPSTGLLQVPASGGEPQVLTKPDQIAGEIDHVWPEALPDGAGVLFTITTTGGITQAQVAVFDGRTGTRKVLLRGGSHAQYVAPGYLIYGVLGTLRAVPFDLTRLEVVGPPVPVLDGVINTSQGAVDASVAADGTLVYVPGDFGTTTRRTLVWVDRQGREQDAGAPSRAYVYPRLSPDGTQVAVFSVDQEEDIWLWEASRQSLTRTTFDATRDFYPVWMPDGRRLVWTSQRGGGTQNLFWQAADGTGTVERLTESPNIQNPTSVTPDGSRMVVTETRPTTAQDLMLLTVAGSRQVTPLVATSFTERNGEVAPDGRWLAYESDESGQFEIYVRPFPDIETGKWQVSTAGGTRPLWARSGRELFYRAPDGAVMGVTITVDGARFRTGPPAMVVESGYFLGGAFQGRDFDVSRDGARFLMIKEGDGARDATVQAPTVVVVQHWGEELKRLVPRN